MVGPGGSLSPRHRVQLDSFNEGLNVNGYMGGFVRPALAGGGHLEVLMWLRENKCPWNKLTCEDAAECGGALQVHSIKTRVESAPGFSARK